MMDKANFITLSGTMSKSMEFLKDIDFTPGFSKWKKKSGIAVSTLADHWKRLCEKNNVELELRINGVVVCSKKVMQK